MTPTRRFLGITTMSPFFQEEGVEPVLDRLEAAGVTAIAVNTSVTAPAPEGEGGWQPPSDAGTSPRLFDRPIWGKTGLWLRSGPGHRARREFFADSPYQPREPNDLTERSGPIIGEAIRKAKARGMKVYIQTSSATPSGLRDEDRPRLPNGNMPDRMANTGSLASPAIRAWNRAWTRDIFAQYPEIDGIRPDWPEYPCYKLDEAFQDFNPHVARWAGEHDFDFERIRAGVGRFYDYLHGELTNDDLSDFATPDRGKYLIATWLKHYPTISEWFRLKTALSVDLLQAWRSAIDESGGPEKELSANAFMTPYTFVTGLDFAAAAEQCESIAPKLYTMHWSLMVDFWGRTLLQANPNLDEQLLTQALVNLMDLNDDVEAITGLDDYGYPDPDEPHPVPDEPQLRKIRQAQIAVRGRARIYPLVHGYGPLDDFRRRFELVARSTADGVWINRYGYLSDAKVEAVGEIWK